MAIEVPDWRETVKIFAKLETEDQITLMRRLVHDQPNLLTTQWMQYLIIQNHAQIVQGALTKLDGGERVQNALPALLDLNWNIDELELPVRAINALRNGLHGRYDPITTIAELVQHSEWDLRRIPNIGRKTLAEIKGVLADHGLCLSRQDLVRQPQ